VICLPYAGGGTVEFRQWQRHVPAGVQVVPIVLPGRETRLSDPAFTAMDPLVEAIAEALPPWLDRPWALFGFSMGSWVGIALLHALRRRGLPLPTNFFACARRAPHLPDRLPPMHALPDDAFVAALQARYNALPAQLLASRELLDVFLPALRADFRLLETWRPAPADPLPVPIAAWYGEADRTVFRHELAAWDAHGSAGVSVRAFPGAHFFLRDSRDSLLTALLETTGFRR
jgi:medium-chain acyl-[acyl-carrier-protein] hydrolase